MKLKSLSALIIFLIVSISSFDFNFAQGNLKLNKAENVVVNKSNFKTPKGYDNNDYQKLVVFLESPSSIGTKNGYELNSEYNPTNPNTWSGITWSENSNVKKIEMIDISFKPNIDGNLDLSGLSDLQTLYCHNTAISGLNLLELSNLVELSCSNTPISSLDLSELSNLLYLYCPFTEISSLNLSELSNLLELYCYNTSISNLDLSNNTNLIYLCCSNTSISSLDLSKLSNLQSLDCSNAPISILNFPDYSSLSYLNCSNCKLGINELKKLKISYPNLFDNKFLQQNLFNPYSYIKGDIKKYGSESSRYKWYIDNKLIDLSTSAYDFSQYKGKKFKCKITDGAITLVSNQSTLVDTDIKIKFKNPPKTVIKGEIAKLEVSVESKNSDISIDKSVSWRIYNSTASTISTDGTLNIPVDEKSKTIIVRATSNFDNTKYTEIKLKIIS